MPQKALLIDLDGVIRSWSDSDIAIENECNLPLGAIRGVAFSRELLLPAITGKVSHEAWCQSVAHELQHSYPASMAAEAISLWSARMGAVNADVLQILMRRRPGVKLILTTNATSRLTADLRALKLFELFDFIANSSELGVAKPAAHFFHATLKLVSLKPCDALFVDDSQKNVSAASEIGLLAHHFSGARALEEFLGNAGVLAEHRD